MVKCPKCKEDIDFLNYLMKGTEEQGQFDGYYR